MSPGDARIRSSPWITRLTRARRRPCRGRSRSAVVAAAAPGELTQVGRRRRRRSTGTDEEALVDGLPEAKLDGDAATEPASDVSWSPSLGRGREPKQFARLEVFEQSLVGGGRGVVELVDHDHVEFVRGGELARSVRQRLHHREEMPARRDRAAAVQFAEARIAQDLPVGRDACRRISSRCATNSSDGRRPTLPTRRTRATSRAAGSPARQRRFCRFRSPQRSGCGADHVGCARRPGDRACAAGAGRRARRSPRTECPPLPCAGGCC